MIRSAAAFLTTVRSGAVARLVSIACFALVTQAHAGPVTFSSLQWTLDNQNADGSAVVTNGGVTLTLTGGNNGSGLEGTTDLVTLAAASGTVSFDYSYSSLDPTPGFDMAEYLLQATIVQFADTNGESGSISFAVTAGDNFGFRMATADNEGEPGILVISDFSAPGTATPEPGTAGLILGGLVLVLASRFLAIPWRCSRLRRIIHPNHVTFSAAKSGFDNRGSSAVAAVSQVSQ